jgi:hypothetical protein
MSCPRVKPRSSTAPAARKKWRGIELISRIWIKCIAENNKERRETEKTTNGREKNHISIERRLIAHSDQLFFTVLLFCLSLTDVLPPLVERPVNETQRQRGNDSCGQNTQAETVPEPVVGCLLLQEDVGANGTSEIAHTDEQSLQSLLVSATRWSPACNKDSPFRPTASR